MKSKKVFSIVAITCMVLVAGCDSNLFSMVQTDGSKLTEDETTKVMGELSWDYPVKPGMAEWNQLKTEEERIAVLQVPESVLATLSPDEIVGLSITLPSFGHFVYWNTPQESFSVMLSRYNILRYLLSQNNVGGSLIAAYKDTNLSGFKTLPYSNEFWSLKLYYIELLLSQKEFLQFLTPEAKLELISEAKSKFEEKITNEASASLPGLLFSVRIMATILDVEKYPEFTGSANEATIRFIETGWFFDGIPQIDEIYRIADDYINAKKTQQ